MAPTEEKEIEMLLDLLTPQAQHKETPANKSLLPGTVNHTLNNNETHKELVVIIVRMTGMCSK